jgi:rod shape-determining protein MreC
MTVNIRYEKSNLFFESVVGLFLSPVQSLFTSSVNSISDVFGHYLFLVRTSKENERLIFEVDRLLHKNNELIEKNKYLERVGKLTAYFKKKEKIVITAKVIGRDATQWSKMLFIDKGTNDNVKKNLVVMTDTGVVGHVIHSSLNSSKVLLITDSRSAIDSVFQNTREPGVTVGAGDGMCKTKFVAITAKVKVGDKVISSGLGGIFPKGLMIGAVVDIVKKKQDLFQSITIAPSANLSNLEELAVVLEDMGGT